MSSVEVAQADSETVPEQANSDAQPAGATPAEKTATEGETSAGDASVAAETEDVQAAEGSGGAAPAEGEAGQAPPAATEDSGPQADSEQGEAAGSGDDATATTSEQPIEPAGAPAPGASASEATAGDEADEAGDASKAGDAPKPAGEDTPAEGQAEKPEASAADTQEGSEAAPDGAAGAGRAEDKAAEAEAPPAPDSAAVEAQEASPEPTGGEGAPSAEAIQVEAAEAPQASETQQAGEGGGGDQEASGEEDKKTAELVANLRAASADLLTISPDDISEVCAVEEPSPLVLQAAKLTMSVIGEDASSWPEIQKVMTQEAFPKRVFQVKPTEVSEGATAALAAARGSDALEPKLAGKDFASVGKLSAWLNALDKALEVGPVALPESAGAEVASLLLAAASVVTVTATTLRGPFQWCGPRTGAVTCAESHTTPTTLPLTCFTETAGILSKGNTTGYTWYNWPTKETRTDRASVRDEPPLAACGSFGQVISRSNSTAHSHIVTGGKRYLWYPQLQHCCFCCDDAAGCGTLVPDWIGNSDGSYQGQVRTPTGVLADKWLVKGLQSNYWYQTPVTGAAVGLDQQPNDVQWWNPER
ncbi:unnamed protein product, partial [Symbiodinium sp. KB8]